MANENKQSFAKLTEDLENLDKEPVVKSEEPKEEPVVEEPKAEEGKEPEVKIEEAAPPVEEVPVVQPEAVEPKVEEGEEAVEKGANCPDCGKPKADCKCSDDKEDDKEDDKNNGKAKKQDDDKKDDKPVKKSADEVEVEAISEADIVGAFEAVVKSFGGLKSDVKSELAELKKSIADLFELIKPVAPAVEEPVEKSAEPAEEPKAEEPVEEPVAKSAEVPVEDEGKAVEYVSKSNGVPEGVQPEGEEAPAEEPVFNAMDHVKEVTDYFMKHANRLTEGEKFAFRGAVNRVKRGEGTQADIDIFRQISGK